MQLRFLCLTLLFSFVLLIAKAQNTSPYWSLAGNSTATATSKLGTTNSIPLNLVTNNATRAYISTDGKFGVGTTTPQQRFHVEGPTLLSLFVNTNAPGPISGAGMIGYVKGLPTASGQRLGYFLLGSRGGAENNYHAAGMVGYAAGAWTAGSSYPAYLAFETTPSGSATRVERMRINANGNVGIGTQSSGNRLFVTDNTQSGPTAFIQNLRNVNSSFNDGLYIQAGNDGGTGGSYYVAFQRPDGILNGVIEQVDENSVVYATTSDQRLKTNIRETKHGLPDVKKIQVRDYNFTGAKKEQTGFLAQQLYEVFPEAVAVGGNDPKTRPWMVDYGRVTPLLVKAVQELSTENEALRKKVEEVETRLQKMEASLKTNNNVGVNLSSISIDQNLPNPARGSTVIRYQLPETLSTAQLVLVNSKGQILKTIRINGGGTGQINLNTTALPAGVYSYSLWVDGQETVSKQLVIAR